jgi:hypothetical protein
MAGKRGGYQDQQRRVHDWKYGNDGDRTAHNYGSRRANRGNDMRASKVTAASMAWAGFMAGIFRCGGASGARSFAEQDAQDDQSSVIVWDVTLFVFTKVLKMLKVLK